MPALKKEGVQQNSWAATYIIEKYIQYYLQDIYYVDFVKAFDAINRESFGLS